MTPVDHTPNEGGQNGGQIKAVVHAPESSVLTSRAYVPMLVKELETNIRKRPKQTFQQRQRAKLYGKRCSYFERGLGTLNRIIRGQKSIQTSAPIVLVIKISKYLLTQGPETHRPSLI
jgi:hypothetical protein